MRVPCLLALALGASLLPPAFAQGQAAGAQRPYIEPLLRELSAPGFQVPVVPNVIVNGRPCDARGTLALGDLDGNGAVDIVYGPILNLPPRVIFNDGHGRLSERSVSPMPNELREVYQIALADLDGDGDLDYLSANLGGPTYDPATILINDGTGRFTNETARRGLAWPTFQGTVQACVAPGDFDLDGDMDFVLGGGNFNSHPSSGYLLRNNGQGYFSYDASAFPLDGARRDPGPMPGFVSADMDGDGDPDLLASCYRGGFAYWLNDGSAHFTDAILSHVQPVPNSFVAIGVNAGDLDGDGDLDLLVARAYIRGPYILYLNDGSGRLTESSAGRIPSESGAGVNPGLIDLEGDGDLDIVSFRPPLPPSFGGDSEVLINDGSGHFSLDPSDQFLVRGRSNGGVSYLGAADMDGDGDADLLASDGCGYPSPPGHQAYFLNTTRHVWAETRPTRGETWRLTVGGRPGGLAVLALAFAKNRGISLPPFGTLALDPSATLLWPRVLAFDLERVAFVELPIPDLPALGGLPLFAQALCIEPNGRARFSNLWIEDAIR